MAESKYYGVYKAIVTNVKDPEKRGRIKVQCPDALGESESGWCEPCVTVAYEYGGDFYIPTVKEGVWVIFIGGNVNKPVYFGGWWTENSTILGENYSDINNLRIISYAGCTILMKNGAIDISVDGCALKIANKKVRIEGDLIVTGKITSETK